MRVDVIVMNEKDTQPVMGWAFRPDRKGELRAVFANGSSQSPDRAWAELALKINRRALKGKHIPVEIFLYLRDGLRGSVYDYGTLEQILAGARDHGWAGRLYVVWDGSPANSLESGFGGEQDQILLTKCFSASLNARVTDLIEIGAAGKTAASYTAEEERQVLRGYAAGSQRRWEALRARAGEVSWGYVLRKDARILESFLSELAREGCLPPSGSSHLVVFDAPPEFGPRELLDEFRRVNRNGGGIVAVTPEGDSKDLRYQANRKSPPLPVLTFNGVVEMAYALAQLNAAAPPHEAGRGCANDSERAHVENVEVSANPPFREYDDASPPAVLITSAFHPTEEPAQSVAAACEVGAVLHELPFHLDVLVHPCITCESLPDLLESARLTAWIHLSHGDHGNLYEPRVRGYASPERWRTCFKSYRSSLKLAIFSACESAAVARLFAEAGVGVAIGFKSEVLVEATRIMAQKVVRAAVREGGDQESILAAFRDACESLAARTYAVGGSSKPYDAAGPVAFRSVRR